jgi:hypothetical protein
MYYNISPILTSNPKISRLGFDKAFSTLEKTYFTPNSAINSWVKSESNSVDSEGSNQVTLKPSYINFQNFFDQKRSGNIEIQNRVNKYNKSIQVLSGDRTGEDKSPTSPY